MNWGKWIVVAFVLFAGFIATLVTVCMRQDVNLVSKDYYSEELAYQDQIVRMNNTSDLSEKPVILRSEKVLTVSFAQFKDLKEGSLKLFSPSDPKKDKSFVLERSNETMQIFSLDNVAKGMYRARMQWTMNDKEYFFETIVNI